MSENIDYLKKMVSAMRKKGSKSLLLELDFLEKLLEEIEDQSPSTESEHTEAINNNVTNSYSPIILHGGEFGKKNK